MTRRKFRSLGTASGTPTEMEQGRRNVRRQFEPLPGSSENELILFFTARCIAPIGDGVEFNTALGPNDTEITNSWTLAPAVNALYPSWCNFTYLEVQADEFLGPIVNRTTYLSKSLRYKIFSRASWPAGGNLPFPPEPMFNLTRETYGPGIALDSDSTVPVAGHAQDAALEMRVRPNMCWRAFRDQTSGVTFKKTTHIQFRVDGLPVTARLPFSTGMTGVQMPNTEAMWYIGDGTGATGLSMTDTFGEVQVLEALAMSESTLEMDIWYAHEHGPGVGYEPIDFLTDPTPAVGTEAHYAFCSFEAFEGGNFNILAPTYIDYPNGSLKWQAGTRIRPFWNLTSVPVDSFFPGINTWDKDVWTVTETDTSIQWFLNSGGIHRIVFDWGREIPEIITSTPSIPVPAQNEFQRFVPSGGQAAYLANYTGSYIQPTTWDTSGPATFVAHSRERAIDNGLPTPNYPPQWAVLAPGDTWTVARP